MIAAYAVLAALAFVFGARRYRFARFWRSMRWKWLATATVFAGIVGTAFPADWTLAAGALTFSLLASALLTLPSYSVGRLFGYFGVAREFSPY